MSGYDASSTVPGAKNGDAGSGDGDQRPQGEASATALGKLFQAPFGGFTFDGKAPAALVGNMLQYAGSYELAHGFTRSSSRLRHGGPRAAVSFAGTPACCVSSAWMPYKVSQD